MMKPELDHTDYCGGGECSECPPPLPTTGSVLPTRSDEVRGPNFLQRIQTNGAKRPFVFAQVRQDACGDRVKYNYPFYGTERIETPIADRARTFSEHRSDEACLLN